MGLEVQHAVKEGALVPTVRTAYRRIEFQTDATATVRVTLDTSLQMVLEEGVPMAAGSNTWCAYHLPRAERTATFNGTHSAHALAQMPPLHRTDAPGGGLADVCVSIGCAC